MQTWKKVLLGLAAFIATLASGYQVNNLANIGGGSAGGRGNYAERMVMDTIAATTTGSAFNVADFANVAFTVATNATSGTIKFACSMSETAPTFSSAASASNRWAFVAVKDLGDGSTIAGTTGLVFTNSSTVRQFIVNNSGQRWCTAILSPWTAGTSTITLLNSNNQ